MLVDNQLLNNTQDVHWDRGGMRANWHVKCLAMLESQCGLVEGSWPVTQETSCPFLVSFAGLLGICHLQLAFPACAAASLAIYVSSLLKRKLLEVWIVTDYAYTQFICAVLSGPVLLLAVKNPGDF